MALYREDATGFLQEHASNPGAGYTAISAMPTDTVANRVAWWRALDTHGQTSTWHPSEYRSPEDPAEAALTIRFSREAGFISADPDGTVTDAYLAANTEVRVYRGFTDVTITEGWALSKVEDGCTSTLTESGGVYTLQITDIPLLATKQGYVRITAERIGVEVVRDFNFIKVLQGDQGADGGTGATVVLDNDSHGILFTDGAGNYAGSGTAVIVYLGGAQLTAHATNTTNCFRITGASASGITAGAIAADKGSIGNHSAMTADTATVTLTIAIYDASGLYATITKKQTLTRNNNGTLVSITATPMVVKKSAAGVFTPSDKVTFTAVSKNLPPGKTTADFIWYFSLTGGSATTTGWDGSWANAGPLNLGINSDYSGAPTWSWSPDSQAPITIGIALSGDTVILDRVTLAYAKDGVDGSDGADGADGTDGTRGSRQILVTTATGAWDDLTAWNGIVSQTGTTPVLSDLVTIAKTDGTVANSKFYSGGASPGTWTTPVAYINGSLLVTGTVAGNRLIAKTLTVAQIDTRELDIRNAADEVVFSVNVPLDTWYVQSSRQNLVPGLISWTYGGSNSRITGETSAQSGDSIGIPNGSTATCDSPTVALFADTHTVSFKAIYYSGGARSVNVYIYTSNYSTLIASTTIPITGSVERYTWTTSAVVSGGNYKLLFSASAGTAQVQIFDIKLERAASASPWIAYNADLVSVNNKITSGNVTTFINNVAINSAQIANLYVDKLLGGTISGQVVILNGVGSVLKSSNYSAGSAGWAILGDGSAEFSSASIRGNLSASKIVGGTFNASSMTVTGTFDGSVANFTNLNATNVNAGTLNFNRLAVGGVPCDRLASGAVTQIFTASTGTGYGSAAINTTIAAWSQSFSAVGANEVRGKVVAEFSVAAYVATTYYVYITLAIYKNGSQVATYQSTPGEFAAISGLYVDTSPGATPSYVFYVTYNTNYSTVSRIANGMLMEVRK